MDIANIMKKMRKQGLLDDLDRSDEVNACSIGVKVDVDGELQDWLLMFKNETHNHPTEIGAFRRCSNLPGGGIRILFPADHMYIRPCASQGALIPGHLLIRLYQENCPEKLPSMQQRATVHTATRSAWRLVRLRRFITPATLPSVEIGALIAAAPRQNVVRARPQTGDIVILLGGRTGRGWLRRRRILQAHDEESLISCGAEVQKEILSERNILSCSANPGCRNDQKMQ